MSFFGDQVLWGWQDWRTWAALLGAIVLLYIARARAHAFLHALLGAVARLLAIVARVVGHWSGVVLKRYEQGLLETRAQEIERELDNLSRNIHERGEANWARYPELHHRLAARLDEIDADYRGSALSDVSAEIGRAAGNGETARRVATETRKALSARTAALRAIARRLGPVRRTLRAVESLDSRLDRAEVRVNESFRRYAELLESDERHAAAAGSSSLTRVLVALFFGTIAAMGAALNFFLIERPMAELVGESYEVAGLPLPRAAALVIILVEMAAGFAFMEFWGVTRMIPTLERLPLGMRRALAIAAFLLIFILACVEAGLALVREDIVQSTERTTQAIQGVAPAVRSAFGEVLPRIVQATLGFVLPFVLALVAIPFELLFIYGRLLLLFVLSAVLSGVVLLLRLAEGVVRGFEKVLLALYDLVIFLPLWVERMVVLARRKGA